jgi:hypothetical protein
MGHNTTHDYCDRKKKLIQSQNQKQQCNWGGGGAMLGSMLSFLLLALKPIFTANKLCNYELTNLSNLTLSDYFSSYKNLIKKVNHGR